MRLHSLLVLVAVAALPATASAATPQPPNCPLYVDGPAKDTPIALPGGGTVTARNPYGALLPRNRLFFDFRVRGGAADLAKVQKIEWAMDGTTVRSDPRAPFEWKGLSGSKTRMPAGDHTIRVTVFTAAGPASTEFAIGATDCQPATAQAFLPQRPGTGSVLLGGFSSFEGPVTAPLLDHVAFTGNGNVAAALPASVRGRAVGTLRVTVADNKHVTYRLRAPRTGTTLLRARGLTVVLHPGRRRFLDVAGLGGETSVVQITLNRVGSRLVALRSPTKLFDVGVTMTAGATSVTAHDGGRYA